MFAVKIFVAVALGLLVLLGVTQLVIPGFAERKVESNLEERGGDAGEAVADVKAFPAVRLLWGSGDRLEIRGRGLLIGIELDRAARPFCEELQERGVLCKETHDFVIRLAPPLVVKEEDLDFALEQLRAVLG